MGVKRIRVSDDAGATYKTLPGSTGDKKVDMSTFKDTVFGQAYESEDTSIQSGMITANAFFKGVAGYTVSIKQSGTPTAMTTEACSLVSGKTYQITAATKRIIDYDTTLQVFDNGVDQTANVLSIDYLSGQVTFLGSYVPTGPITVTGKYLPLAVLAKAKSFTLTQSAAEIDKTTYELAQANGGWREYDQGLKTVKLQVMGIYDVSVGFRAAMATRALVVVEISPDNSSTTVFRGFFKRTAHAQQGNVGALEETTLDFSLWVPAGDLVLQPFGWYLGAGTALNAAVQKCLVAYQAGSILKVDYSADSVTGDRGDAIVTEFTLSNTLEGQNEFKASFRVTGALTAY